MRNKNQKQIKLETLQSQELTLLVSLVRQTVVSS